MQSSHRLRPAMALVRALLAPTASDDGAGERFCASLPPSPHFSGACQTRLEEFPKKSSCHVFGLVNHGQTWRGWERSREKGLIISDNQAQTWLIITINDTSIGDLPLIITISDTCKNQPKRLDFDNTINLSSLIVSLDINTKIETSFITVMILLQ
jgi:hypothetical protein